MKLLLILVSVLSAEEKPVQLHPGMGVYHHAIETGNPEAQKFFNQGLVLLYGFNRYEAFRSFVKAAQLDPQAPMPKWGMAVAQAPHINMDLDGDVDLKKGCGFAQEAAKLAATAPAHEKSYAQTAMAMCQGDEAYRAALRALHVKYPDDRDAATMFAESLMVPVRWRWFLRDGRPAGQMAECINTLEAVLKRDPNHPGANHFYVHATEMSKNPERAIPSAQRLMGGIAPGAGHMVHMAGHTYLRVGEYDIVADANERAIQVDEHYFMHSGVHGGYMGYYAHNVHFLVTARMMQGRFDDAYGQAQKMMDVIAPFVQEAPQVVEAFVATPLFVLLRFGKWDEVLSYVEPSEKLPANRALRHFARAVAHQAKGNAEAAKTEQATLEKMRLTVPAAAIWGNNKASSILQVASTILSARMAGDTPAGLMQWRRAVALQDALVYEEPPAWFYPVRESLGSTLLRMGRYAEAEQVFREALEDTPRSGRVLFGLHEALTKQKKENDAIWVKAEFELASKKSQIPLRPDGY